MLYTIRRTLTPAFAATDQAQRLCGLSGNLFLHRVTVSIPTAFDGTTPKFDIIGTQGTTGWFLEIFSVPVDLTAQDTTNGSTTLGKCAQAPLDPSSYGAGLLVSDHPLMVVVSQDGTEGGGVAGSTVGLAFVELAVSPYPTL